MDTVFRKMLEHPDVGWDIYKAGFKALDVVFYGLAASAAFRLSAAAGATAVPAPPVVPPLAEPEAPATTD